jgi:hypothetical protein
MKFTEFEKLQLTPKRQRQPKGHYHFDPEPVKPTLMRLCDCLATTDWTKPCKYCGRSKRK